MKGSYMKNNILMPTDYEAPVERLEKIQHLKTKARKANNPHGLPLMSICTLVHIFQDTFFFPINTELDSMLHFPSCYWY